MIITTTNNKSATVIEMTVNKGVKVGTFTEISICLVSGKLSTLFWSITYVPLPL